jgi:hypothetical protein
MRLEHYYDSLPLGARVRIPAANRRLRRLLEELGYNVESGDDDELLMRRDTHRLRPILQRVV